MSEVMTCMPFEQLMNWVLEEKKTKGTGKCNNPYPVRGNID